MRKPEILMATFTHGEEHDQVGRWSAELTGTIVVTLPKMGCLLPHCQDRQTNLPFPVFKVDRTIFVKVVE
jgi:hypothetical protein